MFKVGDKVKEKSMHPLLPNPEGIIKEIKGDTAYILWVWERGEWEEEESYFAPCPLHLLTLVKG